MAKRERFMSTSTSVVFGIDDERKRHVRLDSDRVSMPASGMIQSRSEPLLTGSFQPKAVKHPSPEYD